MRDDESLEGQVRWDSEVVTCIQILGCYGVGSGGLLYRVSRSFTVGGLARFRYEKGHMTRLALEAHMADPTGMSHEEVLERYPHLQCSECEGSGNSCCNGPCHKCEGSLIELRSRFERI